MSGTLHCGTSPFTTPASASTRASANARASMTRPFRPTGSITGSSPAGSAEPRRPASPIHWPL